MKKCGAKLRGGGKCKSKAMPNGRCRLHGGATPSGPDSVHFKDGRYARAFRRHLADRFLHASEDDNPLDLLPELAVQRAVLEQYIEDVSNKASLKIGDLKAVNSLTDDVVRTAATIAKVRNDAAMTIAEIKFIQIGMMRLIDKYVPDPNRRRNFVAELIALVPGRDDDTGGRSDSISIGAETTSSST